MNLNLNEVEAEALREILSGAIENDQEVLHDVINYEIDGEEAEERARQYNTTLDIAARLGMAVASDDYFDEDEIEQLVARADNG